MSDILFIHWNADPILLHIGNGGLRWYSLLFVSGFIIGYYIFRWFLRREKISEAVLDPLLYTLLIGTIVGARLGHCIFYDPGYYFGSPEGFLEIFQPWKGGLASHGGAIALIIAMWWFAKHYGKKNGFDFLWIVDRLAITVCFAGALIRFGNLFNSEIYGLPTDLPWGFVFERRRMTEPVHPTMLYEAFAYIILGAVMMRLYVKKLGTLHKGELFGIFLTVLFSVRFVLEFTKDPSRVVLDCGSFVINMGHLLSVPFIIAGIALWIWARRRA